MTTLASAAHATYARAFAEWEAAHADDPDEDWDVPDPDPIDRLTENDQEPQ